MSAEASERQSNAALALSEKLSRESINRSMEIFQNEQRAWVGIIGTSTTGGSVKEASFSFSDLQVVIHNSGRTPALKATSQCCVLVTLPWRDPVPDLDAEIVRDQAKKQELLSDRRARFAEQVKQHPELARSINQMKEFEEIYKRPLMNTIQHDGVLAPSASQELVLMQGGLSLGVQPRNPNTVSGDQFTTCPDGNSMN
jgi:hypothetical protein